MTRFGEGAGAALGLRFPAGLVGGVSGAMLPGAPPGPKHRQRGHLGPIAPLGRNRHPPSSPLSGRDAELWHASKLQKNRK